MKLNYLFVALLGCSTLTLTLTYPALSNIVWKPVAGTKEPSLMDSDPDFWYIGVNTISRKGNRINFDVDANGEYIRYSANCKTSMMSRLAIGSIDEQGTKRVTMFRDNYFKANGYQQLALNKACSQK